MKESSSVMPRVWADIREDVRNNVWNNVKISAWESVWNNVLIHVYEDIVVNVRINIVDSAHHITKNELITKSQLQAAYKAMERL
jgi:hypothetical protein